MTKRILPWLGLLLGLLPLLACATVMKGGDQKVAFQTSPTGAKLSVFNAEGTLVAEGTTPITIPLKKGASYFQAAKYRVVFEAPGKLKKEVWITGSIQSGWYIAGNLLVGGLVGWLIIDPLSGAMWTLNPETVNSRLDDGVSKTDDGLRVLLADQVSPILLAMAKPVDAPN